MIRDRLASQPVKPGRFPDPACALVTPRGRGAIGVVIVVGPDLAAKMEPLFASASNRGLSFHSGKRRVFYGYWKSTGEDVVLVSVAADRIEIHCHGGETASQSILNALSAAGFRILDQLNAAAVLQGNLWKSELAIAIANALTEKTARLLLRQYLLADACLESLASLLRQQPQQAIALLARMLEWSEFGIHLTQPWSVVFCGKPNVGKSSLMNAVAGFGRAIVHQTPGTTRDVVSHVTAVDGWPIEIKDTAGLRAAETVIERIGVDLSQTEIQNADLVVWVLDASEYNAAGRPLERESGRALRVINKVDLVGDPEHVDKPADAIITSAINRLGIEDLLGSMSRILVAELPPEDLLIPINENQVVRLTATLELARKNRTSEAIASLQKEKRC